MSERQPMTPEEFDRACRELERLCPWLSATSGRRSEKRNLAVGGQVGSKHAMRPCMARDYGAEDQAGLDQGALQARKLGFWVVIHDVGSGNHIHVQGLEPGPPPLWWVEKFGG